MANMFLCNCDTSFNNVNEGILRLRCGDNYSSQSSDLVIQKRILKQVGVSQSQYNDVKKSSYIDNMSNINASKSGVAAKHGSYARYLGKLKSKHLFVVKSADVPTVGNKTRNFSLINTSCKC